MSHVLSNMVHPMHVRRHATENGAFRVTKIGNEVVKAQGGGGALW